MAGNNFLQWNPNLVAAQESDVAYAADSLRANGAQDGDVCYAAMDNKFRYQVTTFITAFAQMMAAKGYETIDSDIGDLINNSLSKIRTIDMDGTIVSDWNAMLNKPTIPAAQVPSDWNSVTSPTQILNKPGILTVAHDFASSIGTNGYQKLPSGLIIQWGLYPNPLPSEGKTVTVIFPIAFPTSCLNVIAVPQNTNHSAQKDTFVQITSFTASQVVACSQYSSSTPENADGMFWQAIGY